MKTELRGWVAGKYTKQKCAKHFNECNSIDLGETAGFYQLVTRIRNKCLFIILICFSVNLASNTAHTHHEHCFNVNAHILYSHNQLLLISFFNTELLKPPSHKRQNGVQ